AACEAADRGDVLFVQFAERRVVAVAQPPQQHGFRGRRFGVVGRRVRPHWLWAGHPTKHLLDAAYVRLRARSWSKRCHDTNYSGKRHASRTVTPPGAPA